jgi:hypothetical protein
VVKEKDDWLFPKAAEQRAKQEEKGLVFAQKYLVFSGPTADPRARELLEHWTALVRKTPIPRDASVQEYAAANAFREFIEGLHSQIEFANNGLNQPKQRTKDD